MDRLNDDRLYAKAVTQRLQGQWTNWQNVIQRDFSFHSMLKMSPQIRSFAMGATYDTLASRRNLKRWGLQPDDNCPLCSKPKCTLKHVLSGCKTALADGRYRFRHDSVLKSIAHFIQQRLDQLKRSATAPALEKLSSLPKLLDRASDWVLLVDDKQQLVFPAHISSTKLRPDIILYSNSKRLLIIIELTCPCEEHIYERHLEKSDRYCSLVHECIAAGWATSFFAVEVGARGYAGTSLRKCFIDLGFCGAPLKSALREVSDAACRSSFWIWLRRDDTKEQYFSPTPRPPHIKVAMAKDLFTRKQGFSKSTKAATTPAPPVNSSGDPTTMTTSTPAAPTRTHLTKSKGPLGAPCQSTPMRSSKPSRNVKFASTVPRTSGPTPNSTGVLAPRGIHNVGNSCFMSSTLQFLKSFFRHLTPSSDRTNRIANELTRCLSDLSTNNPRPLYPISFATESRRFFNFPANSFEDAHEYITGLLQFFDQGPFQFTVRHTIVCLSCNYYSSRSEPYFELQLPLSDRSLIGCITAFHQPDLVPDWSCPRCGVLGQNRQSSIISSYPSILLVILKRFNHADGRITKVRLPVRWDDVLLLGDSQFRIIASITHHNSVQSGHYTASVLSHGCWYDCNDSVVSPRRSNENISSDVYLMAYEKM